MVEVIERGKGKTTRCTHCGSKLSYMPNEIVNIWVGPNYGGETPDKRMAIKCPVCENKTRVD